MEQPSGRITWAIRKYGNRYFAEMHINDNITSIRVNKAAVAAEIHDLFHEPTMYEINKKWPVDFDTVKRKQEQDPGFVRMFCIRAKWAQINNQG